MVLYSHIVPLGNTLGNWELGDTYDYWTINEGLWIGINYQFVILKMWIPKKCHTDFAHCLPILMIIIKEEIYLTTNMSKVEAFNFFSLLIFS